MRSKFTFTFAFLFALTFFPGFTVSQTLDETLSNLSSDGAKSYVSPVVSGFGSNLNSGWFAYPPAPTKMSLTARLRIVANGTFFGDEDKTFSNTGMYHFTSGQVDEILEASDIPQSHPDYDDLKATLLNEDWQVDFNGPTIVGDEDEHLRVNFRGETINVNGTDYDIEPYEAEIEQVKGYLDGLKILPSPNIQLTVGTVMGTNLAFRWFPSIEIEDLGKFKFFGIGIIHNTNVWFKPQLPVDLSIGIFYQSLDVGDIFESSATQYGVYASKTFGVGISFTPYVGLSMESSDTKVNYTYNFDTPIGPQETNVSFESEGENDFGFTVGFSAKLHVVNFNIDYKAANSGTLTAGLAFGLL